MTKQQMKLWFWLLATIGLIVYLIFTTPVTFAADATWTHEPSGAFRVVDCDMAAVRCPGKVKRGAMYDGYNMPLGSDPSEPLSPPTVAVATLPLGSTSGGTEVMWIDSELGSDLFFGTWFALNKEFTTNMVGKNKIFFMRAMNNLGNNLKTNGVFMFEGSGQTKRMFWSHNTSGLDHTGICEGECWPNKGPGTFQTGQWVKFEACISGDGTLKWWINNQVAGDYSGLRHGTVFNEWVWNQTWDGEAGRNGKGFTATAVQKVGHVVLSVGPRGMCKNGIGSPPVTPGGVTDVRLRVKP